MRSFFRSCINPKVVVALILVGAATFIFAPGAADRVLPLLFLAACPLSMLLMAEAMVREHHDSEEPAAAATTPASADKLVQLRAEVAELRMQINEDKSAGEPSSGRSR